MEEGLVLEWIHLLIENQIPLEYFFQWKLWKIKFPQFFWKVGFLQFYGKQDSTEFMESHFSVENVLLKVGEFNLRNSREKFYSTHKYKQRKHFRFSFSFQGIWLCHIFWSKQCGQSFGRRLTWIGWQKGKLIHCG